MKTIVMLMFLTLACCGPRPTTPSVPAPTVSEAELDDDPTPLTDDLQGAPAATRHCTVRGALADPTCTPGGIMTTDLQIICHQSTRNRRNVPTALKRQVFADYGIPYPAPPHSMEADHLIPLELGGSNQHENLWPEAAEPRPGFREKDAVENLLHQRVCSGQVDIAAAQRAIASDWTTIR